MGSSALVVDEVWRSAVRDSKAMAGSRRLVACLLLLTLTARPRRNPCPFLQPDAHSQLQGWALQLDLATRLCWDSLPRAPAFPLPQELSSSTTLRSCTRAPRQRRRNPPARRSRRLTASRSASSWSASTPGNSRTARSSASTWFPTGPCSIAECPLISARLSVDRLIAEMIYAELATRACLAALSARVLGPAWVFLFASATNCRTLRLRRSVIAQVAGTEPSAVDIDSVQYQVLAEHDREWNGDFAGACLFPAGRGEPHSARLSRHVQGLRREDQ